MSAIKDFVGKKFGGSERDTDVFRPKGPKLSSRRMASSRIASTGAKMAYAQSPTTKQQQPSTFTHNFTSRTRIASQVSNFSPYYEPERRNSDSYSSSATASAGSIIGCNSELPASSPTVSTRNKEGDPRSGHDTIREVSETQYPGPLPLQVRTNTGGRNHHSHHGQEILTSSSFNMHEPPAERKPKRSPERSVNRAEPIAHSKDIPREAKRWNPKYLVGRSAMRGPMLDIFAADDSCEEILDDDTLRSEVENVMGQLEALLSETIQKDSGYTGPLGMTKEGGARMDQALRTGFEQIRNGFKEYSDLLLTAKESCQRWCTKRLEYEFDLAFKSEEITKLSVKISELDTLVFELQQKNKELERKANRVNKQNERLREERDDRNEMLQRAKHKHEDAEREWIHKLQGAEDRHTKEIQEVEGRHTKELQAAEERATIAVQNTRDHYARKKKEWDQKVQSHETKERDLRLLLEAEKKQLLAGFCAEKEQIQAQFLEEKDRLKKRYQMKHEKLKSERVAREHVKGLTDLELATIFKDFEIKIENISLTEWNRNTEDDWPVPEHTLQQLLGGSPVTAYLKEQIIQSYIWVILYYRIFATPYEVFGEEGQLKLQEWTDGFGTGEAYNLQTSKERGYAYLQAHKYSKAASGWPEPTIESEKMRYDTVKKCIEALQQPDSTGRDRKLKKCFDESIAATLEEIGQTLGRVMSLNEKDYKKLRALITDAANKWLKICSQRYRTLVVLPHSNGNLFKPRQREFTTVRLVKRPEVRRIGNNFGHELGKQEAITNWEGEEVVKSN